jgi:hypothetical protein
MRSIRTILVAGLSWMAVAAIPASVKAASMTLYGITDGPTGGIYSIDQTSGTATLINNLSGSGANTNNNFAGIGFGYLNGTAYASDVMATFGSNPTQVTTFGSVSLTTGVYSPISTLNGATVSSLAANPTAGLLYGINNGSNTLEQITTAGAISTIGTVGALGQTFNGIAFDSLNSTLYGVGGDNNLYSINTSTGVATQVGGTTGLAGTFDGMTFDPTTGKLYVDDNNALTGSLYTLNLTTGAASLVGAGDNGSAAENDGYGITGIVSTAVPEPGTVALSAFALPALGVWVFRQRKRSAPSVATVSAV